jgi:predicted deacylase
MKQLKWIILVIILSFFLWPRTTIDQFIIQENRTTETKGYIIDSKRPGPTVYIIAGIHGNEVAGVLASSKMESLKLENGKLVVLPEANKRALDVGKRTIPSLGDLNRAFPGTEKGRDVSELAFEISNHVDKVKPDIILDLHESKHYSSNEVYALGHSIIFADYDSITTVEDIISSMNKEMEDPYVYFLEEKDGTFNWEMTQRGYTVLTFEGTVGESIENRIKEQEHFIRMVLIYLGML